MLEQPDTTYRTALATFNKRKESKPVPLPVTNPDQEAKPGLFFADRFSLSLHPRRTRHEPGKLGQVAL